LVCVPSYVLVTGPWLHAMCGADMVGPPPLDDALDGLADAVADVDGTPLGGLAEMVGRPPESVFELEEHPAITVAAASNAATAIARGDTWLIRPTVVRIRANWANPLDRDGQASSAARAGPPETNLGSWS
jgi:hypothetical protein